ncbi:LIM domain [Nakaseomyces glabratus]|nr:LIM domain [Nakaseomyces glabratus]KAH7593183.1 LIM domain [Nakaseomyces glabratus]
MYSSMYGSPFPKINPNVRYKTALERAGFDVKTGNSKRSVSERPMDRYPAAKAADTPLKNSSTPVSPSKYKSPNASNKSIHKPSRKSNDSHLMEKQRDIDDRQEISMYKPQGNIGGKFRSTSEQSTFGQYTNDRNSGNNQQSLPIDHNVLTNASPAVPIVTPSIANPIEKSFQMLTQNDTSMSLNSNTSEEIEQKSSVLDDNIINSDNWDERENKHASYESANEYHQKSHSQQVSQYSHHTNENHFSETEIDNDLNFNAEPSPANNINETDTESDDADSLEFNPNADLSANLDETDYNFQKDLDLNDPITNDDGDDFTKPLVLDNKYEKETAPNELSTQKFIQIPNRSFERLNKSNNNTIASIQDTPEEDITGTVTSTNPQLQKLIAQLDDVSLTRNAEIDTLLQPKDSIAILPSDSDVQRNLSKYKKSSAYLSGFPKDLNMPNDDSTLPTEQQNTLLSNRSSNSSDRSDPRYQSDNISPGNGTPVFYKFNQPSPFTSNTPPELNHDEQLLYTPSKNDAKGSYDLSNIQVPSIVTEDMSETRSTPKITKYPPGEGPCRRCNKIIEGKRIFSRKDNELSGQWHRECFQCTKCDIQFNKNVPCYILNDQIFCQQHYHEENNTICCVCKTFIEGECLENDKMERFHTHCLTCILCKKIITSDYYIFNGEIPLCAEHNIEEMLSDGIIGDMINQEGIDRNNTVSRRRTRLINFN